MFEHEMAIMMSQSDHMRLQEQQLAEALEQSRLEAGIGGGLEDYDPVAFGIANPDQDGDDWPPIVIEDQPNAAQAVQ